MNEQIKHPKWFKPEISVGTILTIAAFVVSVTLAYAALDKDNAVQDTLIDRNHNQITIGLERERTLTRDSDTDIRHQMEADRAEMRRQFDKINEKLDELISGGKK